MKKIFIILFTFCFISLSGYADEINDSLRIYPDSIVNLETNKVTLNNKIDTIKVDTIKDEKYKPDPIKAIWMGAIIPGFGQIINRKYWKLPLVYGGFMGFAYAISWNSSRYNSYKNAYRDISDNDPATNSYLDILPEGVTIETLGGEERYKQILNSRQDFFHRYRDLSIILSIGYYGLVLLDAYVDAHLYDFDISPDLVLNVAPVCIPYERNSHKAYGLQCSIRF